MSSCILASTKSSAGAKVRTTKIPYEGLDGKSAKICTSENFLLYSIHYPVYRCTYMCSVHTVPPSNVKCAYLRPITNRDASVRTQWWLLGEILFTWLF